MDFEPKLEFTPNVLLFLVKVALLDMSKSIDVSSFKIEEWTFEITKNKSVGGSCNYSKKIIRVSEQGFFENKKNILVHELLHALNPKQGHKGTWEKQAKKLNENVNFRDKYGKITRCYFMSEEERGKRVSLYRYKYQCTCGKIHYANKRNNFICSTTKEKLIWEKNI